MNNQRGFSLVELFIAFAFIVILIIVGFVVVKHQGTHTSSTTSVKNGEVRLYGKITSDDCFTNGTAGTDGGHGPPIGDVGCSITVNDYSIGIVHGNSLPPRNPGTVTGLDYNLNQVGHYADVYAKQIDAHDATIWASSKYYVKIY